MYSNNEELLKQRFGISDTSASELKDYLKLSPESQNKYKDECIKHPEWNHDQIMSKIAIDEALENYQAHDIMRGVGFDIANSNRLTHNQKERLIKACEDYYYKDKSFSAYEKSLLYRVRNEYHIRNFGLCELAEPSGLLDLLIGL